MPLVTYIGPLAGGFITDHFGWRWIFTVNLPIGIVALVVTSVALRLPFPRREARLDLAGAGLLVVGSGRGHLDVDLLPVPGGQRGGPPWGRSSSCGSTTAST